MINRRAFLTQTSAAIGAAAAWGAMSAGCCSTCAAKVVKYPAYENNLRDRLWMWGHDPGAYDGPAGVYKIPLSAPLSMAEGIKNMGIPNVCVIRGGHPDEKYRSQFKDVKRIAWNLGSDQKSYTSLKEYVFGLRDTTPNMTGYYLDDFFHGRPKVETDPAPAALSQEQMRALYEETLAYKRRLELAIVVYTSQIGPWIKPVMQYVDTVSLWIWDGSDIQKLEANFKKYRALVPDKPTLLGIYMWDFGGKKELSKEFMAMQLDHAFKLYKEGQIEGLIFHCTPLGNKGLVAVDYARDWIAKYGNEGR